jgi:hypothetical protein
MLLHDGENLRSHLGREWHPVVTAIQLVWRKGNSRGVVAHARPFNSHGMAEGFVPMQQRNGLGKALTARRSVMLTN